MYGQDLEFGIMVVIIMAAAAIIAGVIESFRK